MTDRTRVVITIENGVVTNCMTDQQHVDVVLVDYDELDQDQVIRVPQEDGSVRDEPGRVVVWNVDYDPKQVEWCMNLKTVWREEAESG